MSLRRQRFVTGSTAQIRFSPPEGPPTGTLAVAVYDSSGTLVNSGTPTTPPSTTLLTKAVEGTDLLDVVALTGFVSDLDVWVGTAGTTFVEQGVIKEQSGGDLRLYRPTRGAHAVGEELRGGVLVYSHASLAATAGRRFQIKWNYAVGGTTFEQWDSYDVVARVFRLHLTPAEVSLYLPGAVVDGARDVPFSRLLRLAQERVEEVLWSIGVRPDLVRDPGQLNKLGALAWGMEVLERDATLDRRAPEAADRIRERWRMERERLTEAGLEWLDLDEDAAVDAGETLARRRDVGAMRYADFRRGGEQGVL